MTQMTFAEAIRDGMRFEMRRDPNVYLTGEDVGRFGGCFGGEIAAMAVENLIFWMRP